MLSLDFRKRGSFAHENAHTCNERKGAWISIPTFEFQFLNIEILWRTIAIIRDLKKIKRSKYEH